MKEVIDIEVAGRQFRINCTAEEKKLILEAVRNFNLNFEHIKSSKPTIGYESQILMASIRSMVDLVRHKSSSEIPSSTIEKIDSTLQQLSLL